MNMRARPLIASTPRQRFQSEPEFYLPPVLNLTADDYHEDIAISSRYVGDATGYLFESLLFHF